MARSALECGSSSYRFSSAPNQQPVHPGLRGLSVEHSAAGPQPKRATAILAVPAHGRDARATRASTAISSVDDLCVVVATVSAFLAVARTSHTHHVHRFDENGVFANYFSILATAIDLAKSDAIKF